MQHQTQAKKDTGVQEPVPIPQQPWQFFKFVSRPYKVWVISSISIVIVASALSQSTNYFFKLIVDAAESGDLRSAMIYGLLFPTAVFLIQLLYRTSGYTAMRWVTQAEKFSYDTLSSYALRHSHTYFSNRFAGSISSKINNVVGSVGRLIPEFLWTHLASTVSFLITFLFILNVDLISSLLFCALTIVLVYTNRLFAERKQELSRLHAESTTALRGQTIDIFSNVSAVRQYNQRSFEENYIQSLSERQREAGTKNWMYTEKMLILNSFILFIFACGIFWSLISKWSSGMISTGDFVLILALVSQITGTLIFIGRAFNSTARTVGEMEEGLQDLLVAHELVDASEARPLVASRGEIFWDDVTFTFGDYSVFEQFDLRIKAGERVGLVGHSGAGKSTFVSLLLRQHDLKSGIISIDGQNIAAVSQDSLREHMAVVPQEPLLFHRSIRENIAYGKLNATGAEVVEVAKKAQAHDFIEALPQGYETLVGERGVKLSGGQRQRVAIARAMLKNAPILILDEATSALDSESEVSIQKALKELMEGKTVIAIAHRLSTLREMDRIIVLEKGKIVEDGTHAKLIKQGGTYAKLWEHQAGGFLQE